MNIVITGSRKGIGRYLVEYFCQEGHQVAGCSRDMSDYAHENYLHLLADVSKEESVKQFSKQVKEKLRYVDVLINNAGGASMNHFLITPVDTAKRLIELNYIGSFNSCRAFINLLKKSEHPRIINFTTVAVPLNLEGELAYVSSKAAVESFTKVLAKEVSSFNITVNAVGPTPIDTDLTAKVPKEKLNELIKNQSIKRMGKFEDIVNVIEFFASPKSDFITGQILYLGGIN